MAEIMIVLSEGKLLIVSIDSEVKMGRITCGILCQIQVKDIWLS